MLHPTTFLLAAAVLAGIAGMPAISQAQSSKSEAASASKKSPANDEFEENRRAHMQKSKENNSKKGEN